MIVAEKLDLLEQKVEQLLVQFEALKSQNQSIKEENRRLSTQLNELKRQLDAARLDQADRSDYLRDKLQSVMSRIKELEAIGL